MDCLKWPYLLTTILTIGSNTVAADALDDIKKATLFITVTVTEPSGTKTVETGSGFVISDFGYALTAGHLLGSASNPSVEVRVGSRYGETLPATVIQADGFSDLALIQLPASKQPYASAHIVGPMAMKDGEPLTAVGFPLSSDYAVSPGFLSARSGPHGLWTINIPVTYGSSGGAVINRNGDVVGMVKGGEASAPLMNYMIPSNFMAPFIIITRAQLTFSGIQSASTETSTNNATSPPAPPGNTADSLCHEITVMVNGFPPSYTKKQVCQ